MKKLNNHKSLQNTWKHLKIKDIAFINRVSLGKSTLNNFQFKYIDLSSVEKGILSIPTKSITFAESPSRARRIFKKGDILMSTVRPNLQGHCLINVESDEYICSTGFAVIEAKKEKLNNYFLYSYLFSTKMNNYLNNLLVGSNYPAINSSDVANIKINLPPLTEQNRIVAVLETWDKAIERLTNKINLKKTIRKGLRKKLIFIHEDTNEYVINDLFQLGRGRVISKKEIKEKGGKFPVYSSQTSNNGILGKLNTYDFEGEYITWTTDGANAGKVFYRTGKFNCTNVCGTAKLKTQNKHDLYFISTYLNYITKNYVSYVGNPKLMNGVFGQIKINLPVPAIQKKSSEILLAADNEIDILEKKLSLLKDQKKYLLNNLVTGTIRTPENLTIIKH